MGRPRCGPVGPWRIDDDHSVRPVTRQRRRLGTNQLGLLRDLEPPEHAVHAPSAIHVGEQLAEALGLGLGGVHDGLGFGKGRAMLSDDSGNLVEGIATL